MDLSKFQFGVDIATSLAILFSAITFIINQRMKAKETKRRQLDESVRAVAVDELQSEIAELSKIYVKRIVEDSMPLQNAAQLGLARLENHVESHPTRVAKLMDAMSMTRSAMNDYIDAICAYNYQIYPLLDSIEGGDAQIQAFRRNLSHLMKSYSRLGGSHEALINEVKGLVEFTRSHPFETVDRQELDRRVISIITDVDYRQWVDTFIPAGKEAGYWELVESGRAGDIEQSLANHVAANLIAGCYENPSRMLAQVLYLAYPLVQEARIQCKEFLVVLSAINYWLIRKGGEQESLSAIIERYRSPEVFDLETTIR